MLWLALLFFIFALAAGLVGYLGPAASWIGYVEIAFWGTLGLCILCLVASLFKRGNKRRLYY